MKRLREVNINSPTYHNDVWLQTEMHRHDKVRSLAFIEKVSVGDKVLDMGAGVYGWSHYLAEFKPKWPVDIVAVDYSHEAKLWVDSLGLQICYINCNIFDIKLLPDMFDMVGAGEVIEHLDNPSALVYEMNNFCKLGGWMVISTVDTNCEDAKKMVYPEHVLEFTKEDLLALFAPYGKAEYRTVGDYHFIYCQKGA